MEQKDEQVIRRPVMKDFKYQESDLCPGAAGSHVSTGFASCQDVECVTEGRGDEEAHRKLIQWMGRDNEGLN